ncbi:MAG: SprB repeat-containing protein, partial [Bacteroidota bacterium]
MEVGKILRFLTLCLLLTASVAEAQTLKEYYRKSECGLNFAYAGRKVTDRNSAGGAGSGLPCTVSLAGLPATYKVDKAIILYENSYYTGSPLQPDVTVTNSAGASKSFKLGPIAEHVEKCWDELGTRTYRYDVTELINGNGNYRVNTTTPANEIDGVALFVFYVDTVAAYQGSVIFYDGLFTNNVTGGRFDLTMTDLKPCGASSKANAFMLVGDYQLLTHNTTLNGKAGAFGANFWQLDQTTTTIAANQATSTFSTNATATDCFAVVAAGLYFQTTACPLLQVSGNTTICPGGSATLTASGGKSFKWTPATGLSSTTGTTITASPTSTTTYTVSTVCETKTVTVIVDGPTAISTTVTRSNCDQPDGQITVTGASGGKAPYTYAIDGGSFASGTSFTGLLSGTHNVSVKDANGCVYTTSVAVGNQPGITNILATTTNAICGNLNGGITITGVTGGTTSYTYSVNSGPFSATTSYTGLGSGSISVTVKDVNGCEFTKTFTIANSPGPTAITTTTVNESCGQANGSITVSGVSGGTTPYSYAIDGGAYGAAATFTGLTTGPHDVKVRDINNCEFTRSVNVGTTAGPTNFQATVVDESCGQSNGSIRVTGVTGGTSPYTYALDGGAFSPGGNFTGKPASNYEVTVKDNLGCTFKKGVLINNTAPPARVSFTTRSSGCGTPVGQITVGTVTGGVAPYTYSIDGTNYQSGTQFSSLGSGNFKLFVKDSKGCILDTVAMIGSLSGPTDIAEIVISDSCAKGTGQIRVTGVTGGTAPFTYSIDAVNFGPGTAFTNLPQGNYTVTIRDNVGCVFSEGVTVNVLTGVSDFTVFSIPESCKLNNGQLIITNEIDGAAPYQYSLDGVTFQTSSNFSSLDSGKYTVTVRDLYNCTLSKTDSVIFLPAVDSVQVLTYPATCTQSNGSAVFTVFNGTAPFAFSVDNGPVFQSDSAYGLSIGSHTIRVTDVNQCSTSNV